MALVIRRAARLCVTATLLSLCVVAATADNTAEAGREVAAKWEKAIVRVQAVLKTHASIEGREMRPEELTKEITGTIVDPSGLTIVSLSEISPEAAAPEEERLSYKTELSDLKIRLSDGKELPAKVVLRDKDLDMAFLRPREKSAAPFDCVNLVDNPNVQILDPVLVLARLGKVANRALAASMDNVQAIIEKPRKLYVIDLCSMANEPGGSVFTLDGKLAGIVLLRSIAAVGSTYEWDNEMWVVMPTAEIAEVAKQAPEEEAKEPENMTAAGEQNESL